MASWTTPTVRATGDLITASIYNADIVNNIQYLHDTTFSVITGRVGSGGTVQAGSGWGVSRTSTGHYTVTYSVAFSATPDVQVTRMSSGSSPSINAQSASAFSVSFVNSSGGADTDTDFNFVAQPMV